MLCFKDDCYNFDDNILAKILLRCVVNYTRGGTLKKWGFSKLTHLHIPLIQRGLLLIIFIILLDMFANYVVVHIRHQVEILIHLSV